MKSLSNEQHISQEDLLRYVEDDCSRLEMRAIDRHLATCPMCSDAVEGLMLLSEPSVAVADLNKRIDGKIAEKIAEKSADKTAEKPVRLPVNLLPEELILQVVKRPFWQQRWAAAAAVLLLFGASFWFYKNTQIRDNQSVAQFKGAILTDTMGNRTPQYKTDFEAKKGTISTPSSAPNSRVINGELAQLNDNTKGVLTDNLAVKTDAAANDKTPEPLPKPSADIAAAEPNVATEKAALTPASAPVVYAPQVDRTRDYSGAAYQNSVPYPATSVPTKAKDVAAAKEEESDVYNEKKSSKNLDEVVVTSTNAAKKLEKTKAPAAKKDPSVSDQILSRADDNFKQKKYETAVVEYTQFLNMETSGDRYDRALFQVASCYLKLNRKAEAKVIFEKLSAMNGQYERPAKKALKDL